MAGFLQRGYKQASIPSVPSGETPITAYRLPLVLGVPKVALGR